MSVEAKDRLLSAVWDRVWARQQEVGFGRLSHAERVFSSIWMLEAEVNNGGFSQWMFNSSGDSAEFAVAALRELGANAAADVCECFFALLPGGRPVSDQDARHAQLDVAEAQLGEDAFEETCSNLEQEFYALEDDLRDRLFWKFARR